MTAQRRVRLVLAMRSLLQATYDEEGYVCGGGGLYASRSTESWLGGMIMPITIHVNCVTIFFKTWSF